jgi:hypothetical protein
LFDHSLQTADTNWSTPSDQQPIVTYETWFYLSGPDSFGTVADIVDERAFLFDQQKGVEEMLVARSLLKRFGTSDEVAREHASLTNSPAASLRRARNASRSDAGGRSVAGWSKNL